MPGARRPAIPWSDYGVAVGTVALGGLLTLLLWPLMRQMPFAWFFAAVMVSSWRGGFGPGVCATVLATMMSSALLFPSFSAFLVTSSEEHNRLAVFLLIALVMSFLNGSRKRVEGTLRESEARFRLMADHAPVLIWMADATGQYTFFNHPWLAFRGRTPEQEQGMGWREGLHPEDQQRSGEVALTAWQTRQPFQREYRLHRADDVYRWVFESAVPRYLADGTFAGYLGSCVDITERKQAEVMRLRLAAIVESSADAIISKSLDGVVTSWNTAAERMFGYQAEEMIGQPLLRLLPEERHAEEERILARLQQGERVEPFETVRRTKAGRWLDVSVTISPLRDERGTIIGASKTARDITTRKRLEAAIQQERDLLEVTLASIGDAVIATDAAAIITFLNPVAERLTGWPAQEALGRPLMDVFQIINEHTRQPADNPVDKVVREGVTVGLANHTALLTRDGREVPIVDSGAPIRGQDSHIYGAVLVFRDITEQKYIEEALVSAKEAAEAADRLKSEFLATMSHELRTPLNIILGYTDMLIEGGVGELPSPQLDILRRIDRNSRVLFDLISMVLDLNRLEAGRLPVNVKAVQVPDFLAEIKAEMQGLCDQAGLACLWSVAPGLPVVHTDAGKLKVILRNLLSNAVKFTTEGSLTLAATERQDGMEFSVTDTGIGIPAEAHATIFEPFRQLDGSTTRRYSGSGLGLHIVKRLLEVLGGHITVESVVGQGSTFRVWLPLHCAPAP